MDLTIHNHKQGGRKGRPKVWQHYKICYTCEQVKPFYEFSNSYKRHGDGLQIRCKDCLSQIGKESRDKRKAYKARLKEVGITARWVSTDGGRRKRLYPRYFASGKRIGRPPKTYPDFERIIIERK